MEDHASGEKVSHYRRRSPEELEVLNAQHQEMIERARSIMNAAVEETKRLGVPLHDIIPPGPYPAKFSLRELLLEAEREGRLTLFGRKALIELQQHDLPVEVLPKRASSIRH